MVPVYESNSFGNTYLQNKLGLKGSHRLTPCSDAEWSLGSLQVGVR